MNQFADQLPYIPKEISWMSFNHRVLQEAEDPNVPLVERLKFLGIYSSNLDEFFRIRVATLHRMQQFPKKAKKLLGDSPARLQKILKDIAFEQEKQFNRIFNSIIQELKQYQIYLLDEKQLQESQVHYLMDYFRDTVRPQLFPVMLSQAPEVPELKDESIYLFVVFYQGDKINPQMSALLELPAKTVDRLIVLPGHETVKTIVFIDDVVRLGLPSIFYHLNYTKAEAYSVKLNRDAELDIEDDLTQSYIKKISMGLKHRKEGDPVRFVYDSSMPEEALQYLLKNFGLKRKDTLIGSGRYLSHRDLMRFPSFGNKKLRYAPMPALPHAQIHAKQSILEQIQKKDILLHFPYHSFNALIDLLRECAVHPKVNAIRITVYRLATNSSVVNALITAAKNGKNVMVVVELQARFDEENNIRWANILKDEGVKVVFGFPGLKVHSKLCLISYTDKRREQRVAMLGTGNFNETTSKTYTDHILMTADRRLTTEVEQVFKVFEIHHQVPFFKHMWIAPYNLRQRLNQAIQEEINHHKAGQESGIFLKLNNIVDPEIISLLYTAAKVGVPVRLIVRGMYSLKTKGSDFSTLKAISIVDRFLEHSRIFWFSAGGKQTVMLSSADLMTRNLDRRIEAAFPIFDGEIKQEIMEYLEMQWADNQKSRLLDANLANQFKKPVKGEKPVRVQIDWYQKLAKKLTENS